MMVTFGMVQIFLNKFKSPFAKCKRTFFNFSIGVLFCFGCNPGEVEYALKTDFIFVNKTGQKINYSDLFLLHENDKKVISKTISGVSENPNTKTCCQGLLEDFQGSYKQVYLKINDSLRKFFEKDESVTSISNFESKIISKRHFEYTYIIDDKDIENSEPCKF